MVLVTVWLQMEVASLESWYGLAEGHKLLCMEKSRPLLLCSAQLTFRAVVWTAEWAEAFWEEDYGPGSEVSSVSRVQDGAGRGREVSGGVQGLNRGSTSPSLAFRAAKLRSQLKSRLFATAQPIRSGAVKCLPCPSSQQKQQLNLY